MVFPAHLSKGLEFDAVIATCIEDDYSYNNLDIKLLSLFCIVAGTSLYLSPTLIRGIS